MQGTLTTANEGKGLRCPCVGCYLTTAFDGHEMNFRLAAAYGVTNAWSEASKTRALQVAAILAREAKGEMTASLPPVK